MILTLLSYWIAMSAGMVLGMWLATQLAEARRIGR
jgi:hypothetical protein